MIKNGDLTKSVRSASNQRWQNGESRMEFICASKALRPAQKKLLNLAKISYKDLWNINLARIVGGDSESLSLTWDTAMVGARIVGGDSESGSGQSLSLHSLDSVLWPIRDPIWLAPLSLSLFLSLRNLPTSCLNPIPLLANHWRPATMLLPWCALLHSLPGWLAVLFLVFEGVNNVQCSSPSSFLKFFFLICFYYFLKFVHICSLHHPNSFLF